MNKWIKKITIYTVLLYNLLFGINCAKANQIDNVYVQQLNALPVFENFVGVDNTGKENRKEDFHRFREILKDTEKSEGIFTLFRSPDSDEIYLELKPEQLNKDYLCTVTLESGLGESGIYSGLPLQDFLFYFQQVNNNLQFVVRNVKFRAKANQPEVRSLARSFSDSVLYALDIASIDPYTKNILVKLDDLLIQDFPGLTSLLKYYLNADYRLEANKSYFGDVNSFPFNLEIDSIYGFSSPIGADLITLPDSRALTLKVHYSFSQLPENNGYIPRIANDRVGYFITAFQDFSRNSNQEPFVRYINRWHLEPADSSTPLSPPKQPIVFWIENAVPLEYRDAIKEGVLMWNKAFEKAGFENALEVRQMPDDADWHPADIRYNTIRWFNSLDAGFARGPARVNPLTGEILDADIIIDANMVRSVQQEYRALMEVNSFNSFAFQKGGCPSLAKGDVTFNPNLHLLHTQRIDDNSFCPLPSAHRSLLNGGNLPSGSQFLQVGEAAQRTAHRTATSPCFHSDSELCYGMETSSQAAMGTLALSLLHNATPNSDEMKKYVHQYVRSVIAHEVGHTLGLRHNFHGSTMLAPQELNNTEITHTKGLVSSVMDYLPVNIAPAGVQQGDYFPAIIGPYDEWAIEYGYKPHPNLQAQAIIPEIEKPFLQEIVLASSQPELSYATDEDILDINPLANLWDMSSDVLLYSQWQMDNARTMWERLDKYYPSQEGYSDLRLLFNRVLKYYFRNASLLTQYVGGQSFIRHRSDDGNSSSFVSVPIEKQRQALGQLQEYVFADNAFNFPPQLLNQLAPSRWQHWGNPIPVSRLDYPIHERILRFQSGILRSLLNSDRLHRLQDIEFKSIPGQALSMPELFEILQKGIWTEVFDSGKPKPISSIRRSLQREYLNILLEMVLRTNEMPEDGRTLAWYELRQLKQAITTTLKQQTDNLDIYTLAHLEETSDRIHKALNAELSSQ